MKITVYSKPQCPYCDAAIFEATARGAELTVKKLDEDFTREELLEQFPNAKTFPQIIVDGESIGGYTQLMEVFKEQE
jgi:glutaredoxin 3